MLICFSEAGTLKYGVLQALKYGAPQGSILGQHLFLLYVNDLPQSLSDAGYYLYADDTCIFYQHEDVKKIENVLNKEFSSLCQWFIDNKLPIHLGEDKTKSILFSKARGLREINIAFAGYSIKACVCYFYQIFIFSLNDSSSKTMKNVFYFILKALFLLKIFKFM